MQAQRFKSAITITQPAEQTVEILIGRGSWRSLPQQLGISFLFAAVGSAVVAVFLNAASHAIRQVSDEAVVVFVSLTFVACFALALNGVLRLHFRRTMIRITSERFEVEEHMPFSANRTVGWPRAGVFEVRRSGGQLHVRLRRGRPYWLLRERSKWEVDEAVAAINEALAQIPQPVMADIEAIPSKVLAYQSPGEPHEITIEQTPDRVALIIPEAGAEFIERLIPWMMGVCAVLILPILIFLEHQIGPSGRHSLGFLRVPFIYMVVVLLATHLLSRHRRRQPLFIEAARYVRVDHPGLFWRRRAWRREDVVDVLVDNKKDKNGKVFEYFVRMKTRDGRSITFCHNRDSVERKRVVVALRQALGLAPLPESAFPED